MNENFNLELYKSLRGEIVGYIEKVPVIWLQKFTLVGAVIAFLILNYEKLDGLSKNPRSLVGAAMLAVSILAVLLDAKAVEYSLHARAVSKFIQESFASQPAVAAWEAILWGDAGNREILKVVRLRSRMTGIVTSVPTILLMALTAFALYHLYDPERIPPGYIAALISLLAGYVLGGLHVWRTIWPKYK